MSVVAAPSNGFPKTLFMDNTFLWLGASSGTYHLFRKANNHRAGDPQGMNVINGDGSGRWEERNRLKSCGSGNAFRPYPMGSISGYQWTDWG